MTRAGGWSTAHRLGWRVDGLDGWKGGQLLSFSAAGRRHDCYFTMLVCHACRVTSVSRACFAGVHALAPCAPVQSRHATSSLAACYPFPVRQSLARMSLAVYSRCSLARWISYISLCCMLFCTPPMGQGLSPSNWLHPSGAFSAWLREGHWPPENKPLPGGAGGVALWPSRRLLPGRMGLRTGLTGLNQVPAATRPPELLESVPGTLLYPENHAWDPVLVHVADQGFCQPPCADKDKWLACPPRGDCICGAA